MQEKRKLELLRDEFPAMGGSVGEGEKSMCTSKPVLYGVLTACAYGLLLTTSLAATITETIDGVPTQFEEQTASEMGALDRTAEVIVMPEGFRIEPYAIVPDARHMAVAPDGKTVFVGTTSDRVWVLTQDEDTQKAAEVRQFAASQSFILPNGVCFTEDGSLIVAEQNRVVSFPNALENKEQGDPEVKVLVGQGMLIPPSEESFNHSSCV